MVRFIMAVTKRNKYVRAVFTFQYGQIYYKKWKKNYLKKK